MQGYSALAEENYIISIKSMNYNYIRTDEIKDKEFDYYNIVIILENNGNDNSEDITVVIQGEDNLEVKENSTINANSQQQFIFSEFFIEKSPQHQINVSYYPTDLSVHERNEDNSGVDILLIKSMENSSESTPGFEIIFLLLSIIIYYSVKKIIDK
jgi:hypothetical protein